MAKKELYRALKAELQALLADEHDLIANAANTAALVYATLPEVNWAGFYFHRGEELVLGPFQGKPACTRIPLGKGVCGTAAQNRQSIVVPDVSEFPGHIACDPESRSEIVVPIISEDEVIGVLDVDSPEVGRFDGADLAGLEAVVKTFLKHTDVPSPGTILHVYRDEPLDDEENEPESGEGTPRGARVKLRDIVDEMDVQSEEMTAYLDRRTGNVVMVTDEVLTALEDGEPPKALLDWEAEEVEAARRVVEDEHDNFVALPSQFDIHEYSIVEKFCYWVEDEEISRDLTGVIRGRGAFRRFKDRIQHYGIEDQWHKFRDEAFKEIAVEWCEVNRIPYEDA